jgi:tetraacyldisaccharide 4'-kinase
VVDGQRRFGNGLLLPAGPMRELPSRIAKADAIVINGGTASQREYLMQLEGINFYNLLNPEITATVAEIKGVNIHAVAGIGHPMRFFNHLRRLGLSFTAHPYPDHHHFSEGDLEYKGANALLMTEKDAVKCRAYADEKYWVLRVDAHLDSALTQLIIQKITRNGSQTT